jgi:hypothetical protein
MTTRGHRGNIPVNDIRIAGHLGKPWRGPAGRASITGVFGLLLTRDHVVDLFRVVSAACR